MNHEFLEFRERPLEGEYLFVIVDAKLHKRRIKTIFSGESMGRSVPV